MEVTVALPNCSIKITRTDEGVVCDIYRLNGERLVGTWASAGELCSGTILVPEALHGDNVVELTTKANQ